MNPHRTALFAALLLIACGPTTAALAAAPVLDIPARNCGTDETDQAMFAPDPAVIERYILDNRIQAGGVIPVNFHVIYSGAEGNVPESQLDAQIAVLNDNYAGEDYSGNPIPGAKNTGYTFFKNSVTRTNNSRWFKMTPNSAAEKQAKNALATDPTSSLNLYTCKPGQSLLGWATFPWNLASNPKMDGVVVHYGSLPGGFATPYNLGGTASHEIGHWVGLYHTFQGGCHSNATCGTAGDLVCDTPAEGTATAGCPNAKDTCTGTGLDPIHNYMDYSDDACYTNFTPGQDARADFMMSTYRPLIGAAKPGLQPADELLAAQTDEPAMRVAPNPFNPTTTIHFAIPQAGSVSLRVYDVAGRRIATLIDGMLPAGPQQAVFDGSAIPSGVYMAVLKADDLQVVRRMVLTK